MSKKLHVLQHMPFETPGTILSWAMSQNFQVTTTEFYSLNRSLPESKEFDWFDVEKTEESKEVLLSDKIPDSFSAFHWHGDTYELPSGSTRIFRSAGCEQQGFVMGSNILGLQFHLEVTAGNILNFITNDTGDLASTGPFVQTVDQIKANLSKAESLQPILFRLMDNLYASQINHHCGVTK